MRLSLAVLVAIALAAPLALEGQRCPPGSEATATVAGQVHGTEQVVSVISSLGCFGVFTEDDGSFEFQVLPVPQVIYGYRLGHCGEPVEVSPSAGDRIDVDVTVRDPSPPHAMLFLHGGGWWPRDHLAMRCVHLTEQVQSNPGVRTLDELDQIPPPDSVYSIISRSTAFDPVWGNVERVTFWQSYGQGSEASWEARGREFVLADNLEAEFYVLVFRATGSELEAQVGESRDRPGEGTAVRARIELPSGDWEVVGRWGGAQDP